ncbi:hypothetical protein CTRI78_v009670 [Colletotrichum trifolii]|uniref:Uncharacterized protein n=1 Tax=Colletotrichum trifolii TaxID=5466 RepID=A0A4R8QXI0_COLTR|nr:hypothetical protein CTRI78_v009670 [Colletotrichum trifolii]
MPPAAGQHSSIDAGVWRRLKTSSIQALGPSNAGQVADSQVVSSSPLVVVAPGRKYDSHSTTTLSGYVFLRMFSIRTLDHHIVKLFVTRRT